MLAFLAFVGAFLAFPMASTQNPHEALRALQATYVAQDQAHVFDHVDVAALSAEAAADMHDKLSSLDLPYLKTKFDELSQPLPAIEITPFTNGLDATSLSAERLAALRKVGLSLIAEGAVAVILLAGGQGSRLGSALPKGMFQPGLPSGKRIFDYHGERLLRLRELAQSTCGGSGAVKLPWLVMTSPATHAETVGYFNAEVGSENGPTFKYPAEELTFFQQGALPALSFDGKLLLSAPGAPVLAPNGNGGIYKALQTSGLMAKLAAQGVKYVHIIGVDNLLAKPADPAMLGYAAEGALDVVNKVVTKNAPTERVGVMALKNGRAAIVEYSEITEQQSTATDAATGGLLFGAANIASHLYSTAFLQEAVRRADDLPWHVARKKVATYTRDAATGALTVVAPAAENGIKMEMFIFDCFSWAETAKTGYYTVAREDEFAPIKNARVAPVASAVLARAGAVPRKCPKSGAVFVRARVEDVTGDSPDSAVLMLGAAHARLLARAGATVAEAEEAVAAPEDASAVTVVVQATAEVSPRIAYDEYDVENVAGVSGKTFDVPAIISAAIKARFALIPDNAVCVC